MDFQYNRAFYADLSVSHQIGSGSADSQLAMSGIDSISFAEDSDTILVNFEEASVFVINPLAFKNVSVKVTNGNVVINSMSDVKGLNYEISGTTSYAVLAELWIE